MAELYENSDSENAANVADIGFVFSEPGANPPRGFRKVESWSEYEQRLADEAGPVPMASMGDGVPVSFTQTVAAGLTYYYYSDGSYRVVQYRTEPGTSAWTSESQVLTTTVYGADRQVISTVTEQSYAVRGTPVNSVTTSRGNDQNGSTSTTTTTNNPDGSITVTNESSSTVEGQRRESEPTTTTVERDQHREGGTQGPVENVSEQLDSHGMDHTVREYGAGY